MKDNHRFAIFADFLGTKKRYSQPELVVRGRELLEQALNQCVVPELGEENMHLYVFSDTAILTCPRLIPLLKPVARLFGRFIELQEESKDASLVLWLRAGISYGKALYVDHLQNDGRIRTIPFLDTSLPKAYELESIRKGSRIFVDPVIGDDRFRDHKKWFSRWKQITGHGEYLKNVAECMWPAILYGDRDRLIRMTLKLHRWWSKELSRKEWSRDEYYQGMIHLDETTKLFIRTSSAFCPHDSKKYLLHSLLPKSKTRHKNIRFAWGMWFQALKGLVEDCEGSVSDTREVEKLFGIVQSIVSKGGFLQHFLQELEYPDYARFRSVLCRLGLHPSP
jgi:hypothetical protein